MPNVHSWEGRLACAHAAFDQPSPGHALPGDRPRWPRDRAVDVRHIRLDLTVEPLEKRIHGVATHTLTPMNPGLQRVELNALDMSVASVTVDGEAAAFENDGERVSVTLPTPRGPGETFDLAVTYEAHPRLGLYFIGPDDAYPDKPRQVWSQSQDEDARFWFPCYDFPNQKQTTEMRVTVPGTWFALSNGRLLEDTPNPDGTRTFHWLQDRPHATYLVTLAAAEFTRLDASRDGLTIDYYVEPADEARGRLTFQRTPEMIALFERLTGVAYPWAKYSQVVVRDFVFGGMENTSATTMTSNILVDRKATKDFTSDDLISHELAHMWWGDLVTCRDWGHGWLNESFATYFELLWDEERHGLDEYRQGVVVNTAAYLGERYRRPIVTRVFRDPIDIFDRHLYEKGSVVLHTLRGVLGDDQFFRSLQRYARDNQDRTVLTQDLVDAIERETGRNLEWFFDQWVYRPGHPQFKASWSWEAETQTANVKVEQKQDTKDGTAIFRVPVTIDFLDNAGRAKGFRVEITEQEHVFVFPLAKKPSVCRFDPYNAVLKELDFEKSGAELRLQLKVDDSVAGRQFAARQLGKQGGHLAVQALEEAVRADRFWGVKAAAAKALGAVRTPEARDALLRCLDVRHLKARRAVIAALGEFHGDESVLAAIEPIARSGPSWFVEAEAHRSAGRLRLPASFDLLVAGMSRESFRQLIRVGCVDGFVELRDERGFEHLSAAARYGAPHQSRAAAVGALARLGLFFDARRKALGEEVARYLDDPDFRVRIAAANALRTLEDPSRAADLDTMAARELDGRAVRVAREAALNLRTGATTSDEVKHLREEFEQLRDENAKLRGRLERVEGASAAERRPANKRRLYSE